MEKIIDQLLPEYVVGSELSNLDLAAPLYYTELVSIGEVAQKRRMEFQAGRHCARQAIRRLGYGQIPILIRENRTARWPAGITGSITHTFNYAAAIVASETMWSGLGVDAECVGRLDRYMWPHVADPEELRVLESLPSDAGARFATSLFSAKEAFYKAQYSITETFLTFHDARVLWRGNNLEVQLCVDVPRLAVRGTRFTARQYVDSKLVVTTVCISADVALSSSKRIDNGHSHSTSHR